MTTSQIEIRSLRDSDLPAVLDLLRASLGEGGIPRTLAYWRWKHVNNPFGASRGMVAESGGDLIGLRVFMRWRWRAGGELVESVRAVDTATHPRHQGRGVFSRLTLALAEEMQREGTSFVFNTPNQKSRPGYLKMGWQSVGRTTVLIQLRRPGRIALSIAGGWRRTAGGESPQIKTFGDDPRHVVEAVANRGILGAADTAIEGDSRLGTALEPRYFLWRYAEVPGFTYGAAARYRDERGGVVFFRQRARRGLHELRFCDVLVGEAEGSEPVMTEQLRELVARSECDFASAMAARGTPAFRALRRAGFVPLPRAGPVLTVRTLNATTAPVNPLHRSAWRLSIGDLELF